MVFSSSSDEAEGTAPGPTVQKRKLPKSFRLDGTKKFGRTAKGRRVARQHAQKMRESGALSHDSSWKQPCNLSAHPFFTRLPTELQTEVLSHLSPRDLALARGSFQQLHGVIDNFETSITKRTIAYHINRLQDSIDKINATRFPTDADSLLDCMRTWTFTRGSFRNLKTSRDSYNKWFSHLAGGKILARDGRRMKIFQRWAMLAVCATELQREVNIHVTQKTSVHDEGVEEELWSEFLDDISDFRCPLEATEIRVLYEHIRDARGDERAMGGRWHTAKKELATFPSDVTERMTRGDHAREKRKAKAIREFKEPLPEQQSPPKDYGRFRLTPILYDLAKTNGINEVRNPVRPAHIMCANLGLPALPAHNTPCYYVTKPWIFDKLSKSYPDAVTLSPLERAAALECVELF